MAKAFYAKLAASNLVRNKRMYGPYCVAVSLMSGIFFIILNLVLSQSVRNLSYGGTVVAMFTFGIVVMTIFTIGYIFYINSFLIKRRKKEFGLYGVLGMERRHVARVILWEGGILSLGSLLLGMIFGVVFGRLAFMLLMNILDTAKGSVFTISGIAVVATVAVFIGIFILTTLYNLNQVRLANPIDLLKGEKKGEKKVRLPWLITIIGAVMLGYAYYLAIFVRNSAVALMQFWPAVILVIIATWLLFTGGSVFILGRLQKNKRIYYKPRNFIAISGLIHRMKQNAAGLANICILSTMVMVTVSCCCSLYFGQESIVREQSPNDLVFQLRLEDKAREAELIAQARARAERVAKENGASVQQVIQYQYTEQTAIYARNQFTYHDENGALYLDTDLPLDSYLLLKIVELSGYNAMMGADATLAPDEVLLLSEGLPGDITSIPANGGDLRVKEVVHGTPFSLGKNSFSPSTITIVVANTDTAERLAKSIYPPTEKVNLTHYFAVNFDADQEQGYRIAQDLRPWFRQEAEEAVLAADNNGFYRTDTIYDNRVDAYSVYGGLLFLGVFFALLFLINTVLILYFKQISEGFDDGERFAILQKVGLSDQEVKSTINRQMLIVFLLPLVVALIHIVAASNMIMQMLGTFMLTDFGLTMTCIAITSAIFIVVYLIVYRLTARTYYRLVKW